MISHNQTTYEHIISEGILYIGYSCQVSSLGHSDDCRCLIPLSYIIIPTANVLLDGVESYPLETFSIA
jgi:hypothetical protein